MLLEAYPLFLYNAKDILNTTLLLYNKSNITNL